MRDLPVNVKTIVAMRAVGTDVETLTIEDFLEIGICAIADQVEGRGEMEYLYKLRDRLAELQADAPIPILPNCNECGAQTINLFSAGVGGGLGTYYKGPCICQQCLDFHYEKAETDLSHDT